MAKIKTIEEAKAYTELISRLEDVKDAIKKQNYGIAMDILCKPYPDYQIITSTEFKDSEDERIRQFLIHEVKETSDKVMSYRNKNKKDVLAYLEKQGEQKTAWSEEDEKILEDIRYNFEFNKEKMSDALIAQYDRFFDKVKSLKPQPKQEWKQENTGELTDFENAMMHIGGSFFGENAGLDPNDTNVIKEQANLLLSIAPKQEWSEEDEELYKKVETAIDSYYAPFSRDAEEMSEWFKSLKNRIQPQNWTKEDKERYISCLQRLSTGNPEQPETINSKWFKEHVYPQSTWKPSDEQMRELSIVSTGKGWFSKEILSELLKQLKKLREA